MRMFEFLGLASIWLNYGTSQESLITQEVKLSIDNENDGFESEVEFYTESRITHSSQAVKITLYKQSSSLTIFYPNLRLSTDKFLIRGVAAASDLTGVKFYVEQENPHFVEQILKNIEIPYGTISAQT